ncbi:apolipoprotein L3-like [Ambystoma mexicanum]|uniref:apolipoprotein L3-like n=1 Tax=Ambystoma mexicanum TaxID=8296 RepID=UPI0037E92A84
MDDKDVLLEWSYAGDDEGLELADYEESLEMDIEEALYQTLARMNAFWILLEKHAPSFEASITELRRIADGVDRFHHGATIASITGGVVSAAGGITTVVGLILAPFTFGASLIVTGVGLGVAAAGGVTSASATISDTVNERVERGKVENLIRQYETNMNEVHVCLKSLHCQLERLSSHPDFSRIGTKEFEAVALTALPRAGRGIANVVEIVRLAQLGKAAGGLARGIRIAGLATGILTGLFLIMDAIFIAKDAKDLHEGAKTEAAAKIREAADELEKGLHELIEIGCTLKKTQM